jgi:ATP-dependent DNA helicase DinG
LGVPSGAIERIAASPFDFEKQALLVVPSGLPGPNEPEFPMAAARLVREVIEACDGRTLGLFTSYQNLNAVYDALRDSKHRVLRQGDQPRSELTRVFKDDVSSVLLATASFWTGIDVSGEALTGLVIDKLPFLPPNDPVVDALSSKDRNAFTSYVVPRAIITLKQGVGRLIRSKSDIGVVVILDRRLVEKGYGRAFLKSLPPMLSSRHVEHIPGFLLEAEAERARAS